MDCSMARITRTHSSLLDRQLGRFFHALSSAHSGRVGVRSGRAGSADRGIYLATAAVAPTNEMGARFTSGRAPARNDSNRGRFSVELSMAAALPSRARTLRCRSAAYPATLAHWFDHGPLVDRRDQDRKSTRLNSSHMSISYAVF